MIHIELLQLKYFFESAKYESFAKTAQKFMIPTSSVSASVKRLEQELGVKLFDRSSNRIMLNAEGKKFQRSLTIVFSELENSIAELNQCSKDNREIKMLVRAMRSSITDKIIEYSEKHPDITFKTSFDFNETNFENYDIIIDEKSEKYPDYESFELYDMRLRMMVSDKSSVSNRRCTLQQLSDKPFISLGEQSNMHRILISACTRLGFYPNIVVQCNDIQCYEKLIASGIGIGVGREKFLSKDSHLTYLDVSDFNERYIVNAYFKQPANYGNIKHFLNFLKTNKE